MALKNLISHFSTVSKKAKKLIHLRSDAGLEFRSDTFRKWCGENKLKFDTAAPKQQGQNGLV